MIRSACVIVILLCQSIQADEMPQHVVAMQQQESGAFYVRTVIGGHTESDLLLDTGSSYVALSQRTFRKLQQHGSAVYRRSIRGATATGRAIDVKVYSLPELKLGDTCVLHDIEAVVVPGADRDILGLSALRYLQPFALQFEPPTLTFMSCDTRSGESQTVAQT